MIPSDLAACAPNIAPATLTAVIMVESGGNYLALNINRLPGSAVPPRVRAHSPAAAAQLARNYIALGHSVDLGLMQVNSRNLARLGYTIEQMFEPCTNLRAGAAILASNYATARRIHGDGQSALLAALSAYNTGNFKRGFRNGYVAKYFGRSASYRARTTAVTSSYMPTPPAPDTIIVYSRQEETIVPQ